MDDGEVAGAKQKSDNNMTLHVERNVLELGLAARPG